MKYLVVLTDNISGDRPSDVGVHGAHLFNSIREAKASVKEWKAYEESHTKMSWTVKKATIWNLERNFLIDEIIVR